MKEKEFWRSLFIYPLSRVRSLHDFTIIRWFYTTGIGVLLDIMIFQAMIVAGLHVFLSNFISSSLAITFVYLVSVRFVFLDKQYGANRYLLFFSYYMLSIATFSNIISTMVSLFDLYPLLAKVITLPISFFINYYFVSKIV